MIHLTITIHRLIGVPSDIMRKFKNDYIEITADLGIRKFLLKSKILGMYGINNEVNNTNHYENLI